MHFARDTIGSDLVIKSYQPGRIVIGQREYQRSVIITPEQVMADWTPQSFDALSAGHFESLAELRPEMVLLGTGSRLRFPTPGDMAIILTRGIGIDVMDTAAACRTYNILLSESRSVVAALLL